MSYERLSLQPSSASRWLTCRASPGFIAAHASEIPEETSTWADEGTQAHEWAAKLLRNELLPPEADTEMVLHVKAYADFVRDKVNGGSLFVEQKVPLFYMPARNGYVDSCAVSTQRIYITDLKYGEGISVEAQKNPQLAIYGLSMIQFLEKGGLYDAFLDSTLVTLGIFQPRARDKRVIRLWALSLLELKEFCSPITVTATDIQQSPDKQPFAPSDSTCRFCPVGKAGICPHRTGQLLGKLPPTVTAQIITTPDVNSLTLEQVGRIVQAGNALKKFIDSVREHAFALANAGTKVPGCKLVQGKGSRAWTDDARARELLAQKFAIDIYAPRETVSVAAAEKLLKPLELSTKYKNCVNAIVAKSDGKPTLVSDDDPRDAIDSNPVSELQNLDQPQNLLD